MRATVTAVSLSRLFPTGQRAEVDPYSRYLPGMTGGAEPEAHVEGKKHTTGGPPRIGHFELGDLILPVEDGGLGGAAHADAHRVGAIQQGNLGEEEAHDAPALGHVDLAGRVVG